MSLLRRSTIGVLIGAALAVAPPAATLTAGRDYQKNEVSIDAVLQAYAGGDLQAVSRSFTKSTDFVQALRLGDPKHIDRWLGDWDRTKAVLIIELAHVAANNGRQWLAALTRAGRRYLAEAQADPKTAPSVATIEVPWNRIAVGLLMQLGSPLLIEEHVEALAIARKESGRKLDSRLMLARGIARETICWESRPTLEHPGPDLEALIGATDVRIEENLDAPRRAVRKKRAEAHRACLRAAAGMFEAAEAFEDTRAEAVARGAWVLFLEGRAKEAVDKLATANPAGDRVVAYWTALFQGRALSALGRAEQSLAAYDRALALYPGAQSASIGRALELFHLRRTDEVDAATQKVRATIAPDPWITYFNADQRFVDQWLTGLRAVLR
jgi:tetratricopeptide (TPR) repeat protein